MKILLWACAELRRVVGKNRAGENVRVLESVKGLKWPYYAPNPLRGACFAKASQPEGAEDMSKGSRPTAYCVPRAPQLRPLRWSGRYRLTVDGFEY